MKLFNTIVLLFCLLVGKLSSAQDFALRDSLLKHYGEYANVPYEEKAQDTVYFIILNDLAFEYIFINPDSSIYYAELGEAITKNTKYFRYEANSLMYKGMALEVQGKIYEAVNFLEQTEAIFLEHNDSLSLARTLINKAYILSSVNNYSKTLENLLRAKVIVQKINHEQTYYQLTTNLGTLYYNINDFDKAEKALLEANQKYEEVNVKEGIIITSISLGSVYKKKNDAEKAFLFLKNAIKIGREIGNKFYLADALFSLGSFFNETGNTYDAIPLLKESLIISLETQTFKDELKTRCFLANAYLKIDRVNLAREQLEIVKSKAEGKRMNGINTLLYKEYTELAKKEGDFKSALAFGKTFKMHSDSLINNKMNDELHFLSLENINLENKRIKTQLELK